MKPVDGRRSRPDPMRWGRVAAAAMLLVSAASAAAEAGAVQVVERLHASLGENMASDPPRGFAARLAHLEPVVAASFDFDTIARVALGPAFEDLDAGSRDRFRGLMQRLSALTYAERFAAGDGGLRFVTVESRPARRGQTLVRTRLERSGEAPVALDYVLHETGDGPRIINVLADGVSDLSLKRAQYAAVIRDEGVAQLLRRVERQVQELAAKGAASG